MEATTEKTEIVLKTIRSLPPMPQLVQKLLAVMEDDTASADDIGKVLTSDQAMASRVLKLVNSSFYGLSGTVSTISRAFVILGVSAIRNLALGLSVVKMVAGTEKNDYQTRFWNHSIACAAAAEIIARKAGYSDPEEAFIAGLMHDIGHLVLWSAVPKDYVTVMELGPENMVENEKKIIGISHNRAGQKLLNYWKLPRALGEATRFHHTAKVFTSGEDPLVSIIAMADTLAGVHGDVYESSIGSADFLKLIKTVGLDITSTGEILEAMDARIAEVQVFLNIASGEKLGSDQKIEQENKSLVMLCTDKEKVGWTRQVIIYFGHKLLTMKEFFDMSAAGDEVDLVILDPDSITEQQLIKMLPILDDNRDRIVLFGPDTNGIITKILKQEFRQLPLAFSRENLEIISNI